MTDSDGWDVAVVGAGPAGLTAARVAAAAGVRTVVLERAEHPRYKTCGGGLIGTSLAAVTGSISVPVRDDIHTATFTLNGKRLFSRCEKDSLLTMVLREEFDDALRLAATGAGAVVCQRSAVRSIRQDENHAYARLTDGSEVRAQVIVGADGSSGISSRHVGVEFSQVDLGLEVEILVPEALEQRWRNTILLDWGLSPDPMAGYFLRGTVLLLV